MLTILSDILLFRANDKFFIYLLKFFHLLLETWSNPKKLVSRGPLTRPVHGDFGPGERGTLDLGRLEGPRDRRGPEGPRDRRLTQVSYCP